jgi:hypothetical protein
MRTGSVKDLHFPFLLMSNNQQPLLVWFLLLGSGGQEYKGSSASSLSLHLSAVVDELRQAVVTKNRNMLSSVDAAQLRVYKSKAAFMANEEPLAEEVFVSGLGMSKAEALVVSVPTSTSLMDSSPELITHMAQIREIRAMTLGQMVTISKDYLEISATRSGIISELGGIFKRQKARAIAGFPNSRPEHQPGYHLRNPQQQLEDRQRYERLNFEFQQDNQSSSLMNQELNQQTQHSSSVMGFLQELDCFFVMLSRRLDGVLTEDEIDEE